MKQNEISANSCGNYPTSARNTTNQPMPVVSQLAQVYGNESSVLQSKKNRLYSKFSKLRSKQTSESSVESESRTESKGSNDSNFSSSTQPNIEHEGYLPKNKAMEAPLLISAPESTHELLSRISNSFNLLAFLFSNRICTEEFGHNFFPLTSCSETQNNLELNERVYGPHSLILSSQIACGEMSNTTRSLSSISRKHQTPALSFRMDRSIQRQLPNRTLPSRLSSTKLKKPALPTISYSTKIDSLSSSLVGFEIWLSPSGILSPLTGVVSASISGSLGLSHPIHITPNSIVAAYGKLCILLRDAKIMQRLTSLSQRISDKHSKQRSERANNTSCRGEYQPLTDISSIVRERQVRKETTAYRKVVVTLLEFIYGFILFEQLRLLKETMPIFSVAKKSQVLETLERNQKDTFSDPRNTKMSDHRLETIPYFSFYQETQQKRLEKLANHIGDSDGFEKDEYVFISSLESQSSIASLYRIFDSVDEYFSAQNLYSILKPFISTSSCSSSPFRSKSFQTYNTSLEALFRLLPRQLFLLPISSSLTYPNPIVKSILHQNDSVLAIPRQECALSSLSTVFEDGLSLLYRHCIYVLARCFRECYPDASPTTFLNAITTLICKANGNICLSERSQQDNERFEAITSRDHFLFSQFLELSVISRDIETSLHFKTNHTQSNNSSFVPLENDTLSEKIIASIMFWIRKDIKTSLLSDAENIRAPAQNQEQGFINAANKRQKTPESPGTNNYSLTSSTFCDFLACTRRNISAQNQSSSFLPSSSLLTPLFKTQGVLGRIFFSTNLSGNIHKILSSVQVYHKINESKPPVIATASRLFTPVITPWNQAFPNFSPQPLSTFLPNNSAQSADVLENLVSLGRIPLSTFRAMHHHQLESIRFVAAKGGRVLIADEMGVGKTLQCAVGSGLYFDEWPLLVVCQSSLRSMWIDELARWLPGLIPVDLLKARDQRRRKEVLDKSLSVVRQKENIKQSKENCVKERVKSLAECVYDRLFDIETKNTPNASSVAQRLINNESVKVGCQNSRDGFEMGECLSFQDDEPSESQEETILSNQYSVRSQKPRGTQKNSAQNSDQSLGRAASTNLADSYTFFAEKSAYGATLFANKLPMSGEYSRFTRQTEALNELSYDIEAYGEIRRSYSLQYLENTLTRLFSQPNISNLEAHDVLDRSEHEKLIQTASIEDLDENTIRNIRNDVRREWLSIAAKELELDRRTVLSQVYGIRAVRSSKDQWMLYDIIRQATKRDMSHISNIADLQATDSPSFKGAVVISYDLAVRLFPLIFASKFRVLICDECHLLKNPAAKRTRSILPIAQAANRVFFSSGTPSLSRPAELFTQLCAVAPSVFHDFPMFLRSYCASHPSFREQTSRHSNSQTSDREKNTSLASIFRRLCLTPITEVSGLSSLFQESEEILGGPVFTRATELWSSPNASITAGVSSPMELFALLRSICMIRRVKSQVLAHLPPKRRYVVNLSRFDSVTELKMPSSLNPKDSDLSRIETAKFSFCSSFLTESLGPSRQHYDRFGDILPASEYSFRNSRPQNTNEKIDEKSNTSRSEVDDHEIPISLKEVAYHLQKIKLNLSTESGDALLSVDSDEETSDSSTDSDYSAVDSRILPFSSQADHAAIRRSSSIISASALEVKFRASSIVRRSSSGSYTPAPNVACNLSPPVSYVSKRKLADENVISEQATQSIRKGNKKEILTSIMRLYRSTALLKIPSVLRFFKNILHPSRSTSPPTLEVSSYIPPKILIFCHHKLMLDAVESFFVTEGWSPRDPHSQATASSFEYIRIDGSTPSESRQVLATAFQNEPNTRVAILSILAAGVGLTLTASSLAIFTELVWTPSLLLQAEDRIHRITQTKPVRIVYLVSQNSLDQVIWSKIQLKLHFIGSASDGMGLNMNIQDQPFEYSTRDDIT